jgi:hypothetical protein
MLAGDAIPEEFKEADQQSRELIEKLKQQLSEEEKETLQNLIIQQGIKTVEAVAAGYEKGFGEGVRFIFFSLTGL